ncbi:1,4-dihydroxy-2-naphthoate polyprenyltransferase [Tetragenococcus koreensis]|uniref:1,4-dihydroxy-2-naphthoate octaprenyltransferase n=1 Tax=Tetragenococcus koreensis TaxID=290335 RepID=A0AAN4RL27_9ENTE|nr:1,4-dihydroxy-2-naphthoate polyprenyltransferase [Tetragenococcus koreensis]MDN6507392.1 1,4-dihydroxy-2-naphthoate polyprenyltransferase [Tetragenococcus halophilus]AYW46254.1 1,4-dihydroxy-2-naphthoate polyprenyltransferase [Tetragenococcus koreensis]MCF1585043.1 1,4-dihydroxy-2-naphthoate polyprenyltransferase [Tetragenococcus koreensis]MCF1614606.1 1,4-dihydroxy-2-naphthoate polyprenyltransferase [Tetragenococcus koreensis]MCF1617117.1 1,4-dihydroxy-2-naphthoate polyprenyltransferase [T
MSLKVFWEVVEIKTKVASVFPFIIGILFSISYFHEIHWGLTLLFFIGMIIFDMSTTAINNFMDFKKAKSQTYKYQENVIGRERLSPKKIQWMILAMLAATLLIGLVLSIQTGWMMLLMGGAVCFIGVFYTFGPIPLSRMPLGEIFSGVTMGLGIFAITIYLNTIKQQVFHLTLDFAQGNFLLTGQLWGVLALIWASLPLIFTIANIMLANNLRDIKTDIKNHRYTLVYYIGSSTGTVLFQGLMYACYVTILIGWLFGIYSWPILVVFFTLPKISRNLKEHKKSLPQPSSFGYAIKNMVLFNSSYALGLLLCIVWQLM